ncbi:TrmB family transcriptional regulator [Haloarchaeobius sp. HME9146]|uniref:TrmB family transcriptional regulator n=1 Tax=Haloarchaeobius sp. HME9146 TaxID=2978732 RepID=UPI0021BF190B|nr:TrmB family transcriptional regulator [Haloarchaeobius sp. HME9146]MCT9095312.1 TrmB family transcriptional regulator [Haloarchaeobius sp. HME9146]
MSIQQAVVKPTFEPLPETLTSPRAKLVYFFLETAGSATVDEIQNTLGMKKIALLSVLKSLSKDGHVERDGDEYVCA